MTQENTALLEAHKAALAWLDENFSEPEGGDFSAPDMERAFLAGFAISSSTQSSGDKWSDANMLRSIAKDVDRLASNATGDGAPSSGDTLRDIAARLDATPTTDSLTADAAATGKDGLQVDAALIDQAREIAARYFDNDPLDKARKAVAADIRKGGTMDYQDATQIALYALCHANRTADAAAVREAAAIAARNAMVAMEWPPQDGDRQIDEVMAAIRALPLPAQTVPADVEDQGNISTIARAIADRTVPEDGNYRSEGQYLREWKIAHDAALDALAGSEGGR